MSSILLNTAGFHAGPAAPLPENHVFHHTPLKKNLYKKNMVNAYTCQAR
jgi:hypothetical protein